MISGSGSQIKKNSGFHFEEGELLLINKPLTWTSFDAVNKVRWLVRNYLRHLKPVSEIQPKENRKTKLKNLKVGHAGTLDPLATGLLLICTGKMTKSIQQLAGLGKEYTGTIQLGANTPSYDAETAVSETFDTSFLTEKLIRETAKKFTGKILQTPPSYSAKSVDGVRAYTMARKGKDIILDPVEVTIDEFEITDLDITEKKTISFRVRCSKGTYIRSLAYDLGKELGCGAFLSSLCRTKIGDYELSNAWEIEKLEETLKSISVF